MSLSRYARTATNLRLVQSKSIQQQQQKRLISTAVSATAINNRTTVINNRSIPTASVSINCSHSLSTRSFHNTNNLSAGSSSSGILNSDGLIEFNLADIGEGIAECEIIRWFINVGDTINQFDKVCEVQSDKANVEITSRYDGVVVELKYAVGQLAKVGKPLLTIQPAAGSGLSASKSTTKSNSSSTATPPSAAAIAAAQQDSIPNINPSSAIPALVDDSVDIIDSNGSKVLTSPAVRRIAKENSIDIRLVTATGPGGRLLKEDIQSYINKRMNGSTAAAASIEPATVRSTVQATAAAVSTATHAHTVAKQVAGDVNSSKSIPQYLNTDITIPVTGLARIMVSTMTAANAVPQFGYSDEIIVDRLVVLREQLKPSAAAVGIKLSYLPFIIKATSLALRQYPQLNAHCASDATTITHKAQHNIGIAMDTPRGLLVPNIKSVQNLSIIEIAAELQRLQLLGSAGKLGKEDLSGGTFTLSNIGTIGGTYMRPIIVLPEVVIGAIGSIVTKPIYNSLNELKAAKIMYMSWTADHRVVDGATMARFATLWKNYLEHPSNMILYTR